MRAYRLSFNRCGSDARGGLVAARAPLSGDRRASVLSESLSGGDGLDEWFQIGIGGRVHILLRSEVPRRAREPYATIAPPPSYSTARGCPTDVSYEQVIPANKHGYQAGAGGLDPPNSTNQSHGFSVASPDGDAVAYLLAGPRR